MTRVKIENKAPVSDDLVVKMDADLMVIAQDFMHLAEKYGFSRSAVGRVLGISHTSMALVAQGVDILSPLRKRVALYQFRQFCKEVDAVKRKLKARVV